jgi:NADH dehydrogenase/NADH:ubiquinone oxidoreductase subunit G
MDKVKVTIDGQQVEVDDGSYVLDAAKSIGIEIPTLCYYPYMAPYAACRICCVEAHGGGGWSKIVTACNYPSGRVWKSIPIPHA